MGGDVSRMPIFEGELEAGREAGTCAESCKDGATSGSVAFPPGMEISKGLGEKVLTHEN